jgi:hypothetical protein
VQAKQQGKVAVDPFFLQDLGSPDPFPSRGNFNQHPLGIRSCRLVELDQMAGFGNCGFCVVREAGIHLRRDPARNDGQNAHAKGHGQLIDGVGHHGFDVGFGSQFLAGLEQGFIDNALVLGHLGSRCDQRGIGGGILRLKALDGVDIPRIGDHDSHLSQLLQQALAHVRLLEIALRAASAT